MHDETWTLSESLVKLAIHNMNYKIRRISSDLYKSYKAELHDIDYAQYQSVIAHKSKLLYFM